MGRRALKPIDPNLDLSTHFRLPADLPQPWDAVALFGNDRPVEVEVGCGKGLFLSAAASAQPETNFLGIEIGHRYARFAAARLAAKGLPNARMVQGDAMVLMHSYIPAGSLAERSLFTGRRAGARGRRIVSFLDRRRGVF
jgi:tRNA (guanine-N7-)-methyltransferase